MPDRRQSQPMTPAQLKQRKRVQARLTTTGALIGLGALGARGSSALARRSTNGPKLAERLDRLTTNTLTVGAGLGGVAGLNSAAISRQEGRDRRKKPMTLPIAKSAFGVEHEIAKLGGPKVACRRSPATATTTTRRPATPPTPSTPTTRARA